MASADHTINKGISAAKKSISEAFKSLSTNDKASIPKSPSIHPSALPAAKPIQQLPQVASYLPDPCSLESRRTHLSCYLLASQVSVQLRRPNLLRFSTFMDESLDILESSSASCQLDRIFCQFIRLQRIAEEMAELFSFDDPMAKVSIRDPTIQRAITRFGLNLKTWRMKLKESFFTPALRLYYHATVLLCHEISLHVDHNVDDFRMPFTEQIISESSLRGTASPPTIQISAISTCAAAAQSYLDVIYETPLTELIHLPVLSFMRISYCCMVLTKIYTTVATKKSDLASIIELESLGVEGYLNRTLLKLAQASDGEKYSPAGKFSMVLIMLRFALPQSDSKPSPLGHEH